MNPGTMGANALPTFALEAPWVEDYTLLRIGAAGQWGWRDDVSFLPTFQLVTPFGKWASALFEGAAVEAWWASEKTRAEWQLTRTLGLAKADIRFGFKVLLADAGEGLPKLAFRAVTKATTGKDLTERRFVDGPAYLLEALVGQRMRPSQNVTVDVCTSVGYWIWQQQGEGQNDALHWALSVALRPRPSLNLELQTRGYIGWQQNDKPLVFGLRGGLLLTEFFELALTLNAGLLDAPHLEGRLDLTFRLPSLVPLLFGE